MAAPPYRSLAAYGAAINAALSNFCYLNVDPPTLGTGTLGPGYDSGIAVVQYWQFKIRIGSGGTCWVQDSGNTARATRSLFCPEGYSKVSVGTTAACACSSAECTAPRPKQGDVCAGNPCNAITGRKTQHETDYSASGDFPLTFSRGYNSGRLQYVSNGTWLNPLGYGWSGSYLQSLQYSASTGVRSVYAFRPDGSVVIFQESGSGFIKDDDVPDRLEWIEVGGTRVGFLYTTANDVRERYDIDGNLQSVTSRGGIVHTVSRNSIGYVSSVTDSFGSTLGFQWNTTTPFRLKSITIPGGATISFAYDANDNLTSASYPGGTQRIYHYELTDTARKNLLTGITDESSVRFATWGYDTSRRVTSSKHAGNVDNYIFSYPSNGNRVVTNPLGNVRTFTSAVTNWQRRYTGVDVTCGGCSESASVTYDANGNFASRTDFKGVQTTYEFDLVRNLETSRTEAVGMPVERTVSTDWSAGFRLPEEIVEPGRTTTYARDSAGNVLTKTVTDTSVTPHTNRVWAYLYNEFGQVTQEDGPRTDVSDVTTYTYYTCSTGSECGRLHTLTDALGHTTTFLTYNVHGQPLTFTDANGVLTTLEYDERQRLLSTTTAAESTTLSYWPTGLLHTTVDPSGNIVLYSYDDAHRLIRIDDSSGSHIEYSYDAMSNRLETKGFDALDTVRRKQKNVYDTLSRLSKIVGAADTAAVTTVLGYDANGNQTTVNAPLARTSVNHYDALNRLDEVTDAAGGSTFFDYDALDNLTSVTDPEGLITSYAYNGFGELETLTSPDTGVTQMTYDASGNLKTRTDARGASTGHGVFTYDVLNRVTQVAYPDQTITYTYDVSCPNGIGRLCSMSDQSGTTTYEYDARGRVTRKTHASTNLFGAHVRSVGYSYTNGLLSRVTMPSGVLVDYNHDLSGRVSSVTVTQPGGPPLTVASNVQYDPFGAVKGWTWANGSTHSRQIDADGRITQIGSSTGSASYQFDDANRIQSITALSGNPGSSRAFTYDELDRLTSQDGPSSQQQSFTYDANGNRLTQAGHMAATFAYPRSNGNLTSNRQQSASGGVIRNYTYDAAGNITTDAPGGCCGMALVYDGAGRLRHAGEDERRYNALGQRMYLVDGWNDTSYVYDEAGHIIEICRHARLSICDPHRLQEVIWLGDIPLALIFQESVDYDEDGFEIRVNRAVFNVHSDHLNAPRRLTVATDPNNAIRWKWDPDAFGIGFEDGSYPGGSGFYVNFDLRFPGQLFDPGWRYYNYFRDYDPYTGRYLQSDPIGLDGGMGTYSYADGNPLLTIDPDGLSPIKLVKLCVSGFKFIRNVSKREAIKLAKKGEGDLIAGSHAEAREIARLASKGKKPIRDPVHPDPRTGSTDGRLPHYHPAPRTGSHIFYTAVASVTAANYSSCSDCTEATVLEMVDFFNPLAAPKDIIDIYNEF